MSNSTSPWEYKRFAQSQSARIADLHLLIDRLLVHSTEEQIVKRIANISLAACQDVQLFAALNSYLIFKLYQEKKKNQIPERN